MKFYSLILLVSVAFANAQANLSKDQTVVKITNNSSKAVEVRIKARFEDIHGKSTKGGGVRVEIQPGKTESVDLKKLNKDIEKKVLSQKVKLLKQDQL